MATIFASGLIDTARASKHKRIPGEWLPLRESAFRVIALNTSPVFGYGHYTTPAVVYASTDRLLFVKIACPKDLKKKYGQAILTTKNADLLH